MDHQPPSSAWRRHLLGVISIALMVAGVACGLFSETDRGIFAEGVFIKTGTTLLVCWLAYPQLERLNWWVVLPTMGAIGAVVFRPQLIFPLARLLIILAPVLFLLWLLRKTRRS
jgi:sugar phosphate permease